MIYKVTIQPKSPFISELKSTTLYGAICCIIASLSSYGPEVLETIFSSNDALVVSNAFPSGYIPLPLPYSTHNTYMNIEDGARKEIGMVKCLVRGIKRHSGKNAEAYYTSYECNYTLDIYIISNLFNKSDIENIIQTLCIMGIGARRSVGYGQFELVSVKQMDSILSRDMVEKQKINSGYMLLSEYIPNKQDSALGVYSATLKEGKTIYGDKKEDYYVVDAGSVFLGKLDYDDNGIAIIGRVIKDKNTGAYISGRAIAIRVSLA